MYNIYILNLKDGSYYVGSTGNLKQRLKEKEKKRVKTTKNKLPFKLMLTENFDTRRIEKKREYQIKGWKSRTAIERLINKSINAAIV
ncbi:MAG: GIY-YIG nuclease family protein [Candidatus Magasanikbacteria bacterium]|nr:GIY-YIG nuclease family protein [Candidatus Magasanikbacteria bacterium]